MSTHSSPSRAQHWELVILGVISLLPLMTEAYQSHADTMHPSGSQGGAPGGHQSNHTGHSRGVHVVSWNYEYVKQPLLTSLFLLASGVLKLGEEPNI